MPLGIDSRNYSTNPEDYKLLQEVGYGASATVHRAIYLPLNEVIAIKCLDLDRCNANLDDIRREAQTMSLIDHPNVIKAYCSFVVEHSLWVVMPFMAEGSCLHLMKVAYPNGIDEAAICSVLKETLKALDYLHRHGHIHRDVKAGNILLDKNGVVKLGDFGVSACMFDKGDRQRSRNTFVGTPCWMAPEVLQPGSGYDFKADIWSFGITALELAHGHAPFSRYPPMKVLLMTIQSAPPGLDSERDKRFSKSFKEMVAMCLVKDQTKRPTAEKLLKHSFFKHAKPPEMTVADLLKDLPPLWDRVKTLQLKDAAQLALKKMPSAEQEAISQSEYKRGVSAWNFDIEDLKAQASLVQDDESLAKDEEDMIREFVGEKDADGLVNSLGTSVSTNETYSSGALSCSQSTEIAKKEHSGIDMHDVENKDKDNGCDKEIVNNLPVPLASKEGLVPNFPKLAGKTRQIQSGPLVPSVVLTHSLSDRGLTSERSDSDHQSSSDKLKREGRKGPNLSGPIMLPTRASSNSLSAPIRSSGGISSFEDKTKTNNVVQIKGRFSVTSENVDLVKGSPLKKSASVGNWLIDSKQVPANQSTKEIANNGVPVSAFVPYLQNLFQQTSFQQDLIMNLLTTLQYAEITEAPQNGKLTPQTSTSENDTTTEVTTIERERLLLSKISELQTRIANMTDELTAAKLKHVQLQQQLCAALSREEEEEDRLARGREET